MPVSFSGFEAKTFHADSGDGSIEISYLIGGSGPPLLLLHGFPQTKAIWSQVAPELAKRLSLKVPLKLSQKPFSQGLPGSM